MLHNQYRSLCVAGVLLALLTVGCHAHDPVTEALEAEALALHDSLMVIETGVRDALAQVAADVDTQQLEAPVRDSLDAIQADLDTWSGYVVEPPHSHDDHDHDHDHDHASPPEVTPEQMVELQQALLDEIAALQARLERLNLVEIVPATVPAHN